MESLLGVHLHDYESKITSTVRKLSEVWDELELEESDRQDEVGRAAKEAVGSWDAAYDRSLQQKMKLLSQIEGMQREISSTQDQLGQPQTDFAYQESFQGSLMKQYRIIKEELALWRNRKVQRMKEIEALQAKISHLHVCIGRTMHARSFQDLTATELERLGIEIARLQDERQKRQQTLESALSDLRSQCDELGEDAQSLAAEAHPTLLHLGPDGQCAGDDEVDVSDKTIKQLEQKMEKLRRLKAERRQQAATLLGTLEGLWDVLDTADDDVDRRKFQTMLDGPMRVHASTFIKVREEVERLEGRKAEMIRKMIDVKRRELEEICTESHMPVPALPSSGAAPESQAAASAQVAEVLAKVVKQVSAAEAEAERRSCILDAIEELQTMRAECSWLAEYDRDDSRYKGRDANRKLQRAIKAGKARDRMPAVIEHMQGMMEAWLESEGRTFVYDGRDYMDVLGNLKEEVEAEARERAAAHQQKTQGARKAAASTPAKPGMARGGTLRPSTPRTPASARAASPGVPTVVPVGGQAQPRRTPKLQTPRGESMPGSAKDGQAPSRKTARSGSRLSLATEEKMNNVLKSCTLPPPTTCKKTPLSVEAKAQPLSVRVQEEALTPSISSPTRMRSPFSVAAAADQWKSPKPQIPKLPIESLPRTRSF
ncbi:65-kDa microtubule-associated protein 4 [Coccomyxa sp. Obi]|nr:65-kDa microtubule-associated protein 4 [Coccomyxa sp. Obi]